TRDFRDPDFAPAQITHPIGGIGKSRITNADVVGRRRDGKINGGRRQFGHAAHTIFAVQLEHRYPEVRAGRDLSLAMTVSIFNLWAKRLFYHALLVPLRYLRRRNWDDGATITHIFV